MVYRGRQPPFAQETLPVLLRGTSAWPITLSARRRPVSTLFGLRKLPPCRLGPAAEGCDNVQTSGRGSGRGASDRVVVEVEPPSECLCGVNLSSGHSRTQTHRGIGGQRRAATGGKGEWFSWAFSMREPF